MNKVILKICFFLIPIALLLLGVEIFYRSVPNNYILKNENIQKRYNYAEVLIFGNSHTFYGLNPKYFNKSTFNISNISQTLYFDQLLFEKHVDRFDKLKYVILNVEYFTLSQEDNTDEDIWRKYFYESYMDLKVPLISKFDIDGYLLSLNRNFNTNIKLIRRYLSEGTIVDCNESGFGLNYKKESRISNFAEMAPIIVKKHEDHLFDFSKNKSRIQSIVNQCEKRGIKVILVTMPVTKDYAMGVNRSKVSKIFKTCLSIEKSNKNVRYLNLFQDDRFKNDDFFDVDHLHNEGAKKCSLIMNQFINSL